MSLVEKGGKDAWRGGGGGVLFMNVIMRVSFVFVLSKPAPER